MYKHEKHLSNLNNQNIQGIHPNYSLHNNTTFCVSWSSYVTWSWCAGKEELKKRPSQRKTKNNRQENKEDATRINKMYWYKRTWAICCLKNCWVVYVSSAEVNLEVIAVKMISLCTFCTGSCTGMVIAVCALTYWL